MDQGFMYANNLALQTMFASVATSGTYKQSAPNGHLQTNIYLVLPLPHHTMQNGACQIGASRHNNIAEDFQSLVVLICWLLHGEPLVQWQRVPWVERFLKKGIDGAKLQLLPTRHNWRQHVSHVSLEPMGLTSDMKTHLREKVLEEPAAFDHSKEEGPPPLRLSKELAQRRYHFDHQQLAVRKIAA